VDEQTIALARELERRDRQLAAAAAEVDELQQATEELRGRTHEVARLLATLPREREAAGAAAERREDELEARTRAVAQAESELAGVDDERREPARRELERARDALALVETRLERAREDAERLDRAQASAQAEAKALEEQARRVSRRLSTQPRLARQVAETPPSGLEEIAEWASSARAALWVVRSGLDNERERVVREANELGASALGEPLAATSVAGVRARLERAAL